MSTNAQERRRRKRTRLQQLQQRHTEGSSFEVIAPRGGMVGRIEAVSPQAGRVSVTSELYERIEAEQRGIDALGVAIAANKAPASPELARSLQAEENWWRRIEAAHGWLTSTEVSERLGRTANRNYASAQRLAGHVLGYRRGNSYRYPAFQFDPRTGVVRPVIPALLAISAAHQVPPEELVLWLCTPSAYFDEQDEPVNHLDDAQAVLAAARSSFGAKW